MNSKFLILFLLLFTKVVHSQNNNSNLVNSSSNYANNIENNTGELFVVYTFTTNQTATKSNVQNNAKAAVEASQIVLYPNPTKDALYYNLPNDILFECVELYDQYQKVLFSSNENNKQISLANFPSGIYYVMFNKNKEYHFKIIKQ
jgi:hypothetical protein